MEEFLMPRTMKQIETARRNPVQKTIANKEKLIVRLRNEILASRQECEAGVKKIEFRIKMAQTLVDALKKGS